MSGTTETDSEKAALRRVIEELNRILERAHGITLCMVGWPDDIRPGISSDSQAEINRQIGSGYDIYVGLLGARFGTPTPRAGSGTEEEFEAALTTFQADSQQVRVLFYFKRSVEDPFSMDVEQLQKVQIFRDRLGPRGVLYRDFRDTTDFIQMVKDHLHSLLVDEWRDGRWIPVPSARQDEQVGLGTGSTSVAKANRPGEALTEGSNQWAAIGDTDAVGSTSEDDLGLLDYVSAFHEALNSLTETLTRISGHTQRIDEQMHATTAEAESLLQQHEREKHIGGSRAQQQYVANATNVVNRAAGTLDEYVEAMRPDLERYQTYSRAVFENLRHGLDEGAALSDSPEQSDENRMALETLIEVMETNRTHLGGFETAVRLIPALTSKFKRARQRTALLLGEFLAELSFSIDEANVVLNRLQGNGGSAA